MVCEQTCPTVWRDTDVRETLGGRLNGFRLEIDGEQESIRSDEFCEKG
jgi:hypothetical protein